MTIDGLASHCAEETALFFGRQDHDPSYCFELFRRALEKNDQQAWEAVYAQYRPLVVGWVESHPGLPFARGEIDDFVNRAFERLWAAWTRGKIERFRDLKPLLAYLKMCVHSAVVEEGRKAGALRHMVALDDLPPDVNPGQEARAESSVDRAAAAREMRDEIWSAVNARLQDDRERLVVHCLFELDLRPKAIFDRHPGAFRDVREIYLLRQVVLERLSRDPNLRAFVGQDA